MTKSNTLLYNSGIKFLKSFLPKFLTKLFNEEIKKWKLAAKINSLFMLQLVYFSNPFGMTFISKLNLASSSITRCELYSFNFWKKIGT